MRFANRLLVPWRWRALRLSYPGIEWAGAWCCAPNRYWAACITNIRWRSQSAKCVIADHREQHLLLARHTGRAIDARSHAGRIAVVRAIATGARMASRSLATTGSGYAWPSRWTVATVRR